MLVEGCSDLELSFGMLVEGWFEFELSFVVLVEGCTWSDLEVSSWFNLNLLLLQSLLTTDASSSNFASVKR